MKADFKIRSATKVFLNICTNPVMPILLTSLISLRCASDQGGQQGGDPVDGEIGNTDSVDASLNGGNGRAPGNKSAAAQGAAMNNAVDGGSKNNFAGANGGNTSANNGNAALGASLNNVPVEDPATLVTNSPANAPLNGGATPLNQGAANLASSPLNGVPLNGTPLTNGANSTGLGAPPVNGAPTTPVSAPASASTPAAKQDTGARAAASPFANPHMNWPGKGKVKYATRLVTRHAAPNGPVVGEFEQGEHPLVYQNGNWVELNDGSFVKGNGLSDKAVGYSKGKANWR